MFLDCQFDAASLAFLRTFAGLVGAMEGDSFCFFWFQRENGQSAFCGLDSGLTPWFL